MNFKIKKEYDLTFQLIMNQLFDIEPIVKKTCKDCKFKMKFSPNPYIHKIIECCLKRTGKNRYSSYLIVKIDKIACPLFEQK